MTNRSHERSRQAERLRPGSGPAERLRAGAAAGPPRLESRAVARGAIRRDGHAGARLELAHGRQQGLRPSPAARAPDVPGSRAVRRPGRPGTARRAPAHHHHRMPTPGACHRSGSSSSCQSSTIAHPPARTSASSAIGAGRLEAPGAGERGNDGRAMTRTAPGGTRSLHAASSAVAMSAHAGRGARALPAARAPAARPSRCATVAGLAASRAAGASASTSARRAQLAPAGIRARLRGRRSGSPGSPTAPSRAAG